jgi:hypothetical protein
VVFEHLLLSLILFFISSKHIGFSGTVVIYKSSIGSDDLTVVVSLSCKFSKRQTFPFLKSPYGTNIVIPYYSIFALSFCV